MISYLKGKTILVNAGLAVIETGGIGYRITLRPGLSLEINEDIELYVHEHIREDADDLYGFSTYEELELFEKLISVSGVGPRAGLAIMGAASPDKIVAAISEGRVDFFQAISGIGKKVAAKIIIDLKNKFDALDTGRVVSDSTDSDNIIEALLSLGYTKGEIGKVILKIPSDIEAVEKRVSWCLKNLGK